MLKTAGAMTLGVGASAAGMVLVLRRPSCSRRYRPWRPHYVISWIWYYSPVMFPERYSLVFAAAVVMLNRCSYTTPLTYRSAASLATDRNFYSKVSRD